MRSSLFILLAVALLHCADGEPRTESASDAVTSGRIIVHSNAGGGSAAIKKWGYDIKQDGRSRALKAPLVKEIFVDIGMNMLRVPVRASDAHPSAANVTAESYAEDVAAILRVKEAKPSVEIFASVKQIGLSSFPSWVMSTAEGEGVDAAKYTRLIEDYLLYMKGAGIAIDWLGVDNERLFNGGNITPAKYNQIVSALKEWCPANNIATPGFTAPEDYGPGFDADWLRDLWDSPSGSRFSHVDKVGVHIYSKHRDDTYLAKMLTLTNNLHGKALWDSELHWNDLNDDGVHFDELKLGMLTAFDHFDQGYEALSWWAFQPRSTATKSAFIMSELVESTLNSTPLPTDDLDGTHPITLTKFNSRAFKNSANHLTLWVANYKEDRAGQWTEIPTREVESATFVQWSPTSPAEGIQGSATLPPGNRTAFAMSYPQNTITRVTIKLR